MAQHNVSDSALLVKKSRKTIQRYIANGRLTVTRSESGKTQIDTAELIRVFGKLSQVSQKKISEKSHNVAPQMSHQNDTITLTPEQLQNIIKTAVAEALKEVVPLLLENKKEVATSGKSATKAKVKKKVIVNEYADKLGLPSMITKELHEKIIELHNQGVSSRKIEAQLPVSRGSINRTIKASK